MLRRAAVLSVVGLAAAFAALAFLHRALLPGTSALCAGSAVAGWALVQPTFGSLPRFVSRWLDVGAAVTVALVAAAATGLTRGLPYSVLRAEEIVVLAAAGGLVGTATASLLYTHHRLALEVKAQEERLAAAQQRVLESRLSALSSQIHPHFLFNTLNTLAEVVHEDEDQAEELITDLAVMMRGALRGSTGPVPLADELDLVRRLLRIESARLGPRLVWSIDAGPEVAAARVPGLLIQPLVENAVQHAIAPRPEGGRVDVRAVRRGDRIEVTVSDDGPGMPAEPGPGKAGAGGGLRNVIERVALTWPDGRGTVAVDSTGAGTRVVLDFPAEGA